MEINRGGMLEGFILPARGINDMRVAMSNANGHYAAQTIEVSLAGVVPHILHSALNQHDGLFVIKKKAGIEKLLSQRQDLLSRGAGIFTGRVVTDWQNRLIHNTSGL